MRLLKSVTVGLIAIALLTSSVHAYTPPPTSSVLLFLRQRSIQITLPPRVILDPQGIRFAGQTINFNVSETSQIIDGNGFRVTKTLRSHTSGQTVDDYYFITVSGFNRQADPFDFRIAFANDPIPKANIDSLENYLKLAVDHPTSRLSNAACVVGTPSHICLQTMTKVTVPGAKREISLFQTVPVRGIFVEGGVVSPSQIANVYVTNPGSLVLGGNIVNVEGGVQLSRYVENATQVQWGVVGPQLNGLYDQAVSRAMLNTDNNLSGNINLNASNQNYAGSPTSFSSPPEGKLWHHNGNLTVNGATTFSGAGTILISGNLNVTADISCLPGTRLGIITRGNVAIAPSVRAIGCGIYTAIGSSSTVTFNNPNPQGERNFNGIFVAGDSIQLPNPNRLHYPFFIRYDNVAANNPPVLFREFLRILGLTSAP